jgi:hypothetical protein
LQLRYEQRRPYASTTEFVIAGKFPNQVTSLARQIRVGVVNTSKVPARGVRVKLNGVGGKDRRRDDLLIPYDLPWVDTGEKNRDLLAGNEEAFVELLIGVQKDAQAWWYQPYDPTHSTGFGGPAGLPETPEPPFTAYVELVAYAENLADPAVQTFELAYDKATKLGSLKMSPTSSKLKRIITGSTDRQGSRE